MYLRFAVVAATCICLWAGITSFTDLNSGISTSQKTGVRVLRLYPNPAVSYVNFEFAPGVDRDYSIQIYSFMGRKMTEAEVDGSRMQIQLNDGYLRGIYVYHLRNKAGKVLETGKFQVVR